MTWEKVCDDPNLQDLPYKIELNKWGNIEMSPAKFYHSEFQGRITHLLQTLTPDGSAVPECAIETSDNTKVADVAWISYARRRTLPRGAASCTVAPEICVEVVSMSNSVEEQTRKGDLYLEAGALEYWLCDAKGGMRFFDKDGQLAQSRLCPLFPAKVEIPD